MELLPGVQEGQRLTLDGLHKRLLDVEKVVNQVADDDAAITQTYRIKELEGIIHKITEERDDALRDAEYWQSESGASDDYAASIQSQLDELRGKISGLV